MKYFVKPRTSGNQGRDEIGDRFPCSAADSQCAGLVIALSLNALVPQDRQPGSYLRSCDLDLKDLPPTEPVGQFRGRTHRQESSMFQNGHTATQLLRLHQIVRAEENGVLRSTRKLRD